MPPKKTTAAPTPRKRKRTNIASDDEDNAQPKKAPSRKKTAQKEEKPEDLRVSDAEREMQELTPDGFDPTKAKAEYVGGKRVDELSVEERTKWNGIVQKAVKENPSNMRLVEIKIYESKVGMAGYLGYTTIKPLTELQDRFFAEWLSKSRPRPKEHVIATLKDEIMVRFHNPDSNTHTVGINKTRFFDLVKNKDSVSESVLAAGLPVSQNKYPPTEQSSSLPTVSYIVAAYHLSILFPEWCIQYQNEQRCAETADCLGSIHPENWHRLFQALRFFLSLLGTGIKAAKDNDKEDKEADKKTVKRPQNKSALRPHYLADEDMKGVSKKKAEKAGLQTEAALELTNGDGAGH